MATAPTPFFPTTVVPPPLCGCGAPPYTPCSFPPAAAYPSPPFPDGYYTSPFPFYNNPPSFPYTHPASMYKPTFPSPAGFSPNWPPPSLDPTPSTMPPTFSSFPAPTFGAPTTTPALPESTAPPAMDSTPLPAYHASSPPKDVGKFPVRFSPPPPAETPATTPTRRPDKVRSTPIPSCSSRPTTPSREHRPPQSHASYTPSDPIPTYTPRTYCSSPKTSRRLPPITTPPSPMSEASSLLEIPDRASRFELPAYVSALTEMEPVFSASKAQQNKQDTSSVASLPDSFSGATSGSTVSSTIPAPTLLFGFRSSSVSTATSNTSSRCSSDPSKSPSTAAASVAPQMFDAMPTPRSDVENYCYGHTTPVQSSCVHGESTNLGEQPVDEVPESYGFNNLSSHSVFLADGTECIYYALPENFALERDVPKPVFAISDDESDGCSVESVQVFAVSVEESDGCSNKSVHVFTDTEQQTYEEEKRESFQSLKCFSKTTFSVEKPSDTVGIFSLENDARACNFSALKASNSVSTRYNQLSIEHCKRESRLLWDPGASTFLVTPLKNDSSTDSISNEHVGRLVSSTGNLSSQDKTDVWCQSKHQFGVIRRVFEEVMLDKPPAKPPNMYGIAASSPQVILLKIHKAENSCVHFNFWICNSKQLSAIQAIQEAVLVLVIPCSKGKSVSMHSLCSCQMVTIAGQTITFQSCATKSVQVTKNKHPREFLMAEMLLIVSEFRHGQLTYMPQCPTINSSEFERHMVTVLSCWLSSLENRAKLQWDPGIAISSCMDSWLEMRTTNTLTWLQRPLLKDALQCQLPMSNTSCVWDHGIQPISFLHRRLHLHNIQLVRCSAIHINNCTSTTYVCIASSEYPYIVDFLTDQLGLCISKVSRKITIQSACCYLHKTVLRSEKWVLCSLHFYLLDTVNEFWWIIDDEESF